MRPIADFIQAHLQLRFFLPLLLMALATTGYGLFWSVDHFASLTGGLSFMDMQPTLTVDELFIQISSYSEASRRFYLGWSLFDWTWPFITFTTMLFITAWLLQFMSVKWREAYVWFVICAYLTVLMDWLENIGFSLLVRGLPDQPIWLAQTTLALHTAKMVFNMLFNLGFWVLLVAVLISALRSYVKTSRPQRN